MSLADARAADLAMMADLERRIADGSFPRQPPVEKPSSVRRRMVLFLRPHYAATRCITRADVRGAGFTDLQIDLYFDEAARLAGLPQMAA